MDGELWRSMFFFLSFFFLCPRQELLKAFNLRTWGANQNSSHERKKTKEKRELLLRGWEPVDLPFPIKSDASWSKTKDGYFSFFILGVFHLVCSSRLPYSFHLGFRRLDDTGQKVGWYWPGPMRDSKFNSIQFNSFITHFYWPRPVNVGSKAKKKEKKKINKWSEP